MSFKYNSALKDAIANNEIGVSSLIPYKCHWDHNTILTKKNELLQVIKVNGFAFETADDIDLDIKKNLRNSVLKNISSGNIVLYFHTVRRKTGVLGTAHMMDATVDNWHDFADYVDITCKKKYTNTKAYFNELYITVLYQLDKGGVALLEYWFTKLRQQSTQGYWESDMRDMHDSLYEVSTRLINTFADYEPRLLGVAVDHSHGHHCEILKFLSILINLGSSSNVRVPSGALDTYLPCKRLFFGPKLLEARGVDGSKYAGIISIKEYAPNTYAGIFDELLRMPFEFIMTQSFKSTNRTVAINKMQLQQNRMIQAQDKAISQVAEITYALDLAMSGNIGFGEHHCTILCMDNSIKSLENTLSMAIVALSNCGLLPIRETANMEGCFWGQLPGNDEYIVRKSIINTLNLAAFASLHNYPLGKIHDNHWGEYVTILNTTSGTPYYFNFHVKDVGHTLIIGPTGSGKTVLMNFLCAQAQKFRPRMYFFDKDRGAEIFIRAMGGHYTTIDPGARCNFNPLQLPDTSTNRAFLLEWLKLLITVNNEPISAQDTRLLTLAIDGNYQLNFNDRRLGNIVPFLGMNTTNSLASRIALWHGSGSHAQIFDNETDTIDLTQARVFGFEMGELLHDTTSLGPTLLYIFHRINISLDGYPTMIVLDEAWALIDNKVFGPKIRDWLKVLRKLNAFVIFATQSVEDAVKSEISDTLIQQTATQIFLPNLKATESYKSNFMLSEREYHLIRTTDPSSRYCLIKQGIQGVVARLDLFGMTDIINVLSGRADTTALLHQIMAQYGEEPDKWLPVFYKRARELQK